MKILLIAIAGATSLGCTAAGPANIESFDSTTIEYDWDDWAGHLLHGEFDTELPPIPSLGWTPNSTGSWTRHGAQVADQNGDGKVDDLRIANPPSSYNHVIWLDLDFDGLFDDRGAGSDAVRIQVPNFAPLNDPEIGPAEEQ